MNASLSIDDTVGRSFLTKVEQEVPLKLEDFFSFVPETLFPFSIVEFVIFVGVHGPEEGSFFKKKSYLLY